MVRRRAVREPVAYILGRKGFRRIELRSDPRGLVPRPETELLVEVALELAPDSVLDVGTGSGAIALAIADERPDAQVTAIDVSPDALELARENAERTGLAGRVAFSAGDVAAGLPGGPYDLVVSNPPYVTPDEVPSLQEEVRDWEPRTAVVGVTVTEAVARAALAALKPGGVIVLEVGDGKAPEVCGLLSGLGYVQVRSGQDLAGRDRVVEGRLG
jgi:release factor glutamine methyltransferase